MWALVENNKNLITTSPKLTTSKVFSIAPAPLTQTLFIYSLFILIPLCLYTFRFADDNRLLSWYWSISLQQLLILLGILSVALLFVAILVRVEVSGHKSIYLLPLLAVVTSIPFWQQPEVIIDNSRYFTQAKYLELYGISYFLREWGNSIFVWTDLPLVPFIYGLAFQIFGEYRIAIQVINCLFLSGTVLITYLLGKNLWGHQHGMLGAILLLGIPYLYTQVPLMLVDIPAMFFLSLALLVTLLSIKRGDWRYTVFAAISITLAMLSKYSVWLMLSVIPILLLVLYGIDGDRKKVISKHLLGIASGVFVLSAIVAFFKYDAIRQQLFLLFDYQWSGLGRWQESNVSSYLFHVYPFITFLALLSIVTAIKKRDWRFMVIAWLPLLVAILEIKRMRYLIPILPMVALMAAYGLTELRGTYQQRFVAYGTACSAFLIALIMNTGFLQNTSADNIRQAGEYLNSVDVRTAEVMVMPQHGSIVNPLITIPTLDYYTNKIIVYSQNHRLLSNQVPHQANKSSVRFTWEYTLPAYYDLTGFSDGEKKVLVVVYSHANQLNSEQFEPFLQQYQITKEFNKTTGVFKYQTMVNIYEPI